MDKPVIAQEGTDEIEHNLEFETDELAELAVAMRFQGLLRCRGEFSNVSKRLSIAFNTL